jgi:hypothetical protein
MEKNKAEQGDWELWVGALLVGKLRKVSDPEVEERSKDEKKQV